MPHQPEEEEEPAMCCATLLETSKGWCVRHPDTQGNAVRIYLDASDYQSAFEEANRKLPPYFEWTIA